MVNDPIADLLARLRNAAEIKHSQVLMPASKLRVVVAKILKDEGYIEKLEITKDKPQPMLRVWLRYDDKKKPVLSGVRRVQTGTTCLRRARPTSPGCGMAWASPSFRQRTA